MDEWKAHWSQQEEYDEASAEQNFHILDADKSGDIDKTEMERMVRMVSGRGMEDAAFWMEHTMNEDNKSKMSRWQICKETKGGRPVSARPVLESHAFQTRA